MTKSMTARLAFLLCLAAGLPAAAAAQNLGPFRQFLSVEPYYVHTRLDLGTSGPREHLDLNGYGARLWLNSAPFGLTDKLGVGLYANRSPRQNNRGATVLHYGGQLELFPFHRPAGGIFDPFLTAGAGGYRVKTFGGDAGISQGAMTELAAVGGGGFRVPIPNRFQLRFDARDVIVFRSDVGGGATSRRTAHNLELLASLGLTF